jgi:hypothetical protein
MQPAGLARVHIQQPSVSSSWSRGLERDGLLIHAGLVYSNRPRAYLKSILHAWLIATVRPSFVSRVKHRNFIGLRIPLEWPLLMPLVHGNEADEIHRNTVPTPWKRRKLNIQSDLFFVLDVRRPRQLSLFYSYQRRATVRSKNKKSIMLVTRWLRNWITVTSMCCSFSMLQTIIYIPILYFPILCFAYAILFYSYVFHIPAFFQPSIPKEPVGFSFANSLPPPSTPKIDYIEYLITSLYKKTYIFTFWKVTKSYL